MVRILSLLLVIFVVGLAPVNAADLTVKQLKNSSYLVPAWEDRVQDERVHLQDGEYRRDNPDNLLYVMVVDIALGHLSPGPHQDAAVIYGYNTGGTGFFVMLCAVLNDHGQPRNVDLADLGDRVKINSLRIQSGKIIIDMVTHGPHDPACCPTVNEIATYALVDNKLVKQ